jgi:hypothetical protein
MFEGGLLLGGVIPCGFRLMVSNIWACARAFVPLLLRNFGVMRLSVRVKRGDLGGGGDGVSGSEGAVVSRGVDGIGTA